MKMDFDKLTDIEKFRLAETYLSTKKTISIMDIVTVASIFGVTISQMIGSMADSDFFRFAPLATIPLFAVFACKKIKLSKRYKKASNKKVNYAKIRSAEISGEIEELHTYYVGKVEENTKVAINLAKLAGTDASKLEEFLKDREEKRNILNQVKQESTVEQKNIELKEEVVEEQRDQIIEDTVKEEIKVENENDAEDLLESTEIENLEDK